MPNSMVTVRLRECGGSGECLGEMKPFTFETPVTVTIRHKRLDAAQSAARSKGGWKRIDPYTVERTVAKITDQF